MSTIELAPKYNSKDVEHKLYEHWEKEGYFKPRSDETGKTLRNYRYVIVIPPPNVTGILHMGHALNNSIQDILVRYHRMIGRDTLWIPGVDHAGIATQNVVEKKLAKEKKTRNDLGREKFLEEVWKWKEDHGNTITRQLRRLGASCDWSRERFTMDEGLSKAVREAFVQLYEKGLIYQGNYIINWCPRCQTALSDEEAAHKEVHGAFYHIKYLISGAGTDAQSIGEDHIVVATTRPETMLGDSAVAVHPEDERYRHLIGKTVVLPLLNREIPIIGDEFVDPAFGTGMVKVTPAHDPNDFEMGKRHGLPEIRVMYPDGKMNENAGPYHGLDRFEARKKIVADLEAAGLFVRRDTHSHSVGHCYRCDSVVEPYLSKQWFVRMKPLAEKALDAHANGKTVFFPDRWTKVYTNWLEGIRDWCISRQIWWGHQIPVWYCDACVAKEGAGLKRHDMKDQRSSARTAVKGVIVSRETPEACPACGNKNLRQDPDVLDTWFSSWLWPFSTLGWPARTQDAAYFYPTSDLVTAPEILFFWVARMIMAGLEFMNEVPFARICLHGTVRAASGLKMSKSLGNAIDPLEVIDEMGADALRFSLVMLSAQDVYLSREKFEVGRNFTNKLWNASRFVFMNLGDFREGKITLDFSLEELTLPQRWILSRFEETAAEVGSKIAEFQMSQAASLVYHFVWNDFCDWFIEFCKPVFTAADEKEKLKTKKLLFFILEKILRLCHPFMPFITEEIWLKMKNVAVDQSVWPESVSLALWPVGEKLHFQDPRSVRAIEMLQQAVSGIRDLRTQLNIPPSEKLKAVVRAGQETLRGIIHVYSQQVMSLARLESLEVKSEFAKNKAYVGNTFADFDVYLHVEGVLDFAKERVRVEKKIEECRKYIESLSAKLSNKDFVEHAPADIVAAQREKLEETRQILRSQQDLLSILQ